MASFSTSLGNTISGIIQKAILENANRNIMKYVEEQEKRERVRERVFTKIALVELEVAGLFEDDKGEWLIGIDKTGVLTQTSFIKSCTKSKKNRFVFQTISDSPVNYCVLKHNLILVGKSNLKSNMFETFNTSQMDIVKNSLLEWKPIEVYLPAAVLVESSNKQILVGLFKRTSKWRIIHTSYIKYKCEDSKNIFFITNTNNKKVYSVKREKLFIAQNISDAEKILKNHIR